jgi:hypothetical protein
MLRHVQRRWLDLTTIVLGVWALAIAVALAVWPLHGNGLSGNAVSPTYSKYVGFYSYTPLPPNPTKADLRRAGITLPQDVINARRRDAETLGAVGILLTGLGLSLRHNAVRITGERSRAQDPADTPH